MSDWFYLEDGQRIGPVDAKSLKALAQSGQLGPKDYVWTEGMPDWKEAIRIKGLFPKGPPPPPPSAVPSGTAVSPTIASPETVTPESRSLPQSLPESATATATSQSQTFATWYSAKFGHLPIAGQAVLWLFYGFVWIPVYYATSNSSGSSKADGESSPFNLWFVWCCIPYLAFVGWLHAGIRSNHKPYFAWAVVYVLPFLLLFFAAVQQPEAEPRDEVMVVIMFAWFAGIIHASLKRQEVNLRIKFASAGKSGDVQLEERIRAEYEGEQPASANDTTQAVPTPSFAIPNQTSIVFRFFLFVGAGVGAWLLDRLLDGIF